MREISRSTLRILIRTHIHGARDYTCMPHECCVEPHLCLPRGARLLFIGDSLTRYQYLDLVYRLAGKEETLLRENDNPLSKATWRGGEHGLWYSFYNKTSSELGSEQCDCYRDSRAYSPLRMCESRSYHSIGCNVSVSYRRANGGWPLQWHAVPNGTLHPMTDSEWAVQEPHLQRHEWAPALPLLIEELQPNVLVLAAAYWPTQPTAATKWLPAYARALNFSAIREAGRSLESTGCVVWKTATASRPSLTNNSRMAQNARYADLMAQEAFGDALVFDAKLATQALELTSASFVDDVHFTWRSGAYRALNVAMLHLIRKHGCWGRSRGG